MQSVIEETGLIRPTTITGMVSAWRESEQKIREAHRLLGEASDALQQAFDGACNYMRINYDDLRGETCEAMLLSLKRKAWSTITEKINVKKVMIPSRLDELNRQLERGDLPDITEANIMAMLETTTAQMGTMIEEYIKEVYQWLRPNISPAWHNRQYKTNIKCAAAGVGEKVIKAWVVEYGYGERPWRMCYSSQARFLALDNVFSMLDGKGIVKSHHGPTFDAIAAADKKGWAETPYFELKCFRNRNLHLRIKRLDLLEEFNKRAAGMNLNDEPVIH